MEHDNNLISVHFENSAFEGFSPGFAPDGCTVHCGTLYHFRPYWDVSKTYGSIPLKLWENTPYGVRNKSTISFLSAIQVFGY